MISCAEFFARGANRVHPDGSQQTLISLPDKVTREILLSFWKVHVLHHAAEKPIYGHWIAVELRRHGYHINPGTLYPLLKRMEEHGWLRSRLLNKVGARVRREYRLTKEGARILSLLREHVKELYQEVVKLPTKSPRR